MFSHLTKTEELGRFGCLQEFPVAFLPEDMYNTFGEPAQYQQFRY